jgi:hypothetical protein
MKIMPESKEAFEQAPVATTDITSSTRSAGTVTSNTPAGQLQSMAGPPELELQAVTMSKPTPANARNRLMVRTLAPAMGSGRGHFRNFPFFQTGSGLGHHLYTLDT